MLTRTIIEGNKKDREDGLVVREELLLGGAFSADRDIGQEPRLSNVLCDK